jgi:hypothetical protein
MKVRYNIWSMSRYGQITTPLRLEFLPFVLPYYRNNETKLKVKFRATIHTQIEWLVVPGQSIDNHRTCPMNTIMN